MINLCFFCQGTDVQWIQGANPNCGYWACPSHHTPNKEQQMRALIRQELDRSLIPNLNKLFNSNSIYVKKLKAHPKFLDGCIEELIELQLPFYMMADEETAKAAFNFFTSKIGKKWCDLAGAFNDKLSMLLDPFLQRVIGRLDALESN